MLGERRTQGLTLVQAAQDLLERTRTAGGLFLFGQRSMDSTKDRPASEQRHQFRLKMTSGNLAGAAR